MSTTFVTAASTLDASINRLKNIKAQAQIYHKHQIAEAQHLSVEALRVSNDAKLAADRVEAMKKTLSLFHLERRIKDTVQKKEKIQTRLILIAPTVEEESHALTAAEVRKEDPPTSLVTTAPAVNEKPNGTVIEEELAKDNPVKNEPVVKEGTALQEVTKNETIEEQTTQEENIRVDTAFEEEVTTEETIEEEAQTEEEITTVDTLVEDIEEFTKDQPPHQLADLIVLLKQYQKKESLEEASSEKEAASSKKERTTTHEKAVTTTKSRSEEEAATKEDIAIETVIETGRVVKVMETWRVVTQPKGIVALDKPEGGGVDNNRSHAVRPATVFPRLLSWTAADSDNVVVHEHCWCERV